MVLINFDTHKNTIALSYELLCYIYLHLQDFDSSYVTNRSSTQMIEQLHEALVFADIESLVVQVATYNALEKSLGCEYQGLYQVSCQSKLVTICYNRS